MDSMNKIVPVLSLMLAFGLLGFLALNSSNYMTVSDLKGIKRVERVVVMGNVSKGSVHFDRVLKFKIHDNYFEVNVVYPSYVRLDNVSGYGTVVVSGVYYPSNRTIVADRIELRCPSKT